MHVTTEDLVAALRSAGLRVTRPRRAVCEVVAAHHAEHLTAASIAARVAETADQSTVYRTLDALEQAGVITHTHFGHGPLVYHLQDDDPHQHLVCEQCGRAVAFDRALMDDAIARVRDRTGFSIDPAHFALSGLCADCGASSG